LRFSFRLGFFPSPAGQVAEQDFLAYCAACGGANEFFEPGRTGGAQPTGKPSSRECGHGGQKADGALN
jgi:hypothetical protein